MPSQVQDAAQAIADALAQQPDAPSARWRWGSVVSVNADGTMNVSIGGATVPSIRCAQHVMGAQVGDRVRVLYCGTECMVDAVRASSGAIETVYETADVTVKRWGRTVMVHCHGIYATPNSGNAWANIDLSAYKPGYNVSAIVAESTANGHIARLWVSATDGKVYLNAINSTAAANWYGTLTYIF